MNTYQKIDMETYNRRNHFEYFKELAYPYVGVTVNVDITEWMERREQKQNPFFLSILYEIGQAANRVPEIRQRIVGEEIRQYDHCKTSFVLARDNGTFCYCQVRTDMPFQDFLPYAQKKKQEALANPSIEDDEEAGSYFFVSSIPWFSQTSLIQPVPSPADSNPRITIGRYFQQEKRTLLPISILCHHALVDGIHLAAFYENLSNRTIL